MKVYNRLFSRELLLAYRNRGELANPLIFFLMVTSLLPLGVSPEPGVLSMIAPGMIWVVALLSSLLSLDGLFKSDYEDGCLEQLMLMPVSLYLVVMLKVLVHWLVSGLPLVVFAPLLATMLFLPDAGYLPMVSSLLLGTLSLSFIGAIGAGLTVSLRRSGQLLSVIIMPLYIPVLIFGASTVRNAVEGFSYLAPLLILAAFTCAAVAFAPLAVVAALQLSVDE
ncbi:MAG: heme exporter protein CcmB [Pseudomonadales bacterium]|nr:heme exporter protein CcmB [Pseudomonadales bacterium]